MERISPLSKVIDAGLLEDGALLMYRVRRHARPLLFLQTSIHINLIPKAKPVSA